MLVISMDGRMNTFFMESLKLFDTVQWLHNVPVTQILCKGGLEELPAKWLEDLEMLDNHNLNRLVTDKIVKPEWTDSLKDFVQKCKELDKLSNQYLPLTTQLPTQFVIGLSPKKQHEIMHLAQLVHTQCRNFNIKTVVDVGAGLGYVCQLLHHLYGYRVLGLEASEANVKTARARQQKFYPTSIDHVKYVQCNLKSNSAELIDSIILQEFQKLETVCLIGLHACGDLSAYAAKMFTELKIAQILILVPCCYHKLSLSKEVTFNSYDKQYFHYFPMSAGLRKAIEKLNYDTGLFLRQPFLRLACQESADRWNNMTEKCHNEHSLHVLARGVLQLFANNKRYVLKKLVQKGTRKSQCLNFETYVKDALLRYSFEPIVPEETENNDKKSGPDDLLKEIMELWSEHAHNLTAIEIYTALQLLLQGPAESLILYDRLCWFEEQGFETTIVPVMNKELSPRSNAIVSRKR